MRPTRAGRFGAPVVPTLLLLTACAALPTADRIEHATGRLDRQLQALEGDGFAGQVLVVHGDEVLLRSGYGTMGRDDPRPVTDEAVMPLASISKPFTASAIYRLAADGELDLGDRVGKHLVPLQSPWADLTIERLLSHSAGLPAEIVRRDRLDEHRFEPLDRDAFLARVQHFEPEPAPGDGFRYGNVSYGILAALVETLTGQVLEDVLADRLFAPAGIEGIGVLRPEWAETELVRARNEHDDLGHYLEAPRLPDGLGYNIRGAGDLHARPAAVLNWWQALRAGTWLPAPWQERWLQPRVREPDGSRHGHGLHFRDSALGRVIGHTGGEAGFTADLSWYVEPDLLVYINSAHANFPADELRARLERLLVRH